MLNTSLIEEFQRVNANRKTGALIVQSGRRRVRFFFEQGELCILDYCQDKEDLVARQYRIYNKIGAEMEAALLDHVRQDGRAQDFLLRQQLVTAEEIEQVTRTLVEDTLCDVFGNEHSSVDFDSNLHYEDFDFGSEAVKLRIQVDMLLRMVSSRVAERDSVVREIPDWSMIFGLVEGAPDAQRLNEMERCVLHFIDGSKTVRDISTALRESSMNIGCYLVSLMVQGYVRPSGYGTQSSLRPAATAGADRSEVDASVTDTGSESVQQEGAGQSEISGFEVYRGSDRPVAASTGPSRAPLFILLSVLTVMVGIFVLVVIAEYAQEQIGELRRQIEQDIETAAWQAADERLAAAFSLAAGDDAIREHLTDFRNQLNERELIPLLESVAGHLDEENLALARAELDMLPSADHRFAEGGLWSQSLLGRLRLLHARFEQVESGLRQRIEAFEAKVVALLNAGDIDQVIALLDQQPQHITSSGRRALRQWRRRAVDQAADETVLSLTARRELLQLVMRSDPPDDIADSAQQILRELEEIDARLESEVMAIEASVESGDYIKANEQLASWRQRAEGHPIETRLDGIEAAIDHARNDAESRLQNVIGLIESARDASALQAGRASIDAYLQRAPSSSLAAVLREGMTLLDICREALNTDTVEDELAMLPEATDESMYDVFVPAIAHRRRGLRDVALAADREVQRAQELRQARQLTEALNVLEELRDTARWQRTTARREVEPLISELTESIRAREARLDTLRSAMINDDMDLVIQLQRELDLRRHLFCIRSTPSGASVLDHEGVVLGITPLVIEESLDAPDHSYRLVSAGYIEVTVNRHDRSAGWRIHRSLDRAADTIVALDVPLTNAPQIHDGSLWVAGPRGIYRINPDATHETKSLEGPHGGIFRPVPSPVYAPISIIDSVPMLPTRDLFAIEIGPERSIRRPLGGRTDLAMIGYTSMVVIDRRLLIVAGIDGALHAHDPYRDQTVWSSAVGEPFISGPVMHDDLIVVARRNGRIFSIHADTGQQASVIALGETVLSIHSDGSMVSGLTPTKSWQWETSSPQASFERLPFEAVLAGSGAAISTNRRAWQKSADGSWEERGRLSIVSQASQPPVSWGDHVVVVYGHEAQVIGPRPFTFVAEDQILPPVVAGNDLWFVTVNGNVTRYRSLTED